MSERLTAARSRVRRPERIRSLTYVELHISPAGIGVIACGKMFAAGLTLIDSVRARMADDLNQKWGQLVNEGGRK